MELGGMQFMTALFGGTTNTLVNSAFALGIVLILIVLGLWALKWLTKATGNLGRGKDKRLVVVDKAVVDGKRQVVIIRRDNVEHMIMTGGPQDLVIESGFAAPEPPQPQRRGPAPRPAEREAPQRAAQRPATGSKSRPAAAASAEPAADIDPPITPERPVPREAVDRLGDLARPAPLRPRQGVSLRHTNLLRSVREDSQVIPMPQAARGDNAGGSQSDSAKTAPIEGTNGLSRFGRSRFIRSISRRDGN
jgi:hypothetical protein